MSRQGRDIIAPTRFFLDSANAAAAQRNIGKAEKLYEAILNRVEHTAGVRFNLGRARAAVQDWTGSLEAARAALADCANYRPAAGQVVQALEALGHTEEAKAYREIWGQEE
jgi:hypothetical protein